MLFLGFLVTIPVRLDFITMRVFFCLERWREGFFVWMGFCMWGLPLHHQWLSVLGKSPQSCTFLLSGCLKEAPAAFSSLHLQHWGL